jgi:hypothetical protein
VSNKRESYSKDIPIDNPNMAITWAMLRQAVDEFLQEHDISADVQIEYFDFSWSNYGSVTVSYSDGRLVIR